MFFQKVYWVLYSLQFTIRQSDPGPRNRGARLPTEKENVHENYHWYPIRVKSLVPFSVQKCQTLIMRASPLNHPGHTHSPWQYCSLKNGPPIVTNCFNLVGYVDRSSCRTGTREGTKKGDFRSALFTLKGTEHDVLQRGFLIETLCHDLSLKRCRQNVIRALYNSHGWDWFDQGLMKRSVLVVPLSYRINWKE